MNKDIAEATRPMTDESGTVTAARSRAAPKARATAHDWSGRAATADALPIRSPATIGAGKAGDAR